MNSGKVKKTSENANDNKVRKITDALTVVMNRMNAVEKLIRPPSKILVKSRQQVI